jgi:NAD(P)-dependent dehydrogenase (short-subunit alcohol dehydrogenase family)
VRQEDHAWHWAGRVGLPSDVARMCAFLADGSQSGFITGQQFVVDGGVSRRMVYPE